MSRTADGDLLAELSGSDRCMMLAPRGSTPVPGAQVTLWRLPGTWSVWSAGPVTGTWWLNPSDGRAQRTAADLATKPDRGLPDVVQVAAGRTTSIAVRTKAIRAGGR